MSQAPPRLSAVRFFAIMTEAGQTMPDEAERERIVGSASLTARHGRGYQAPSNIDALPPRPSIIEPVFDAVRASKLLPQFDESLHRGFFGEPTGLDSERFVPKRPESFIDAYLGPTLTKNEYPRLTALWYYTDGVQEDHHILARLDRIINLVKQSFSWELGIVGILDATTYTRLATVNLPLAILPRSECTCSHTVNQEPGTVLVLQDMSQDWRFQHSPHVEICGLRSYAAAQIRLVKDGAEDVVFGGLCVASLDVQDPLTEEQKRALINAADLVAGELVAWKQACRSRDRQSMQGDLNELRISGTNGDIRTVAIQSLRQRYPGARVSLTDATNGTFDLGAGIPIEIGRIKNGIWEDEEVLASLLRTVPFGSITTKHPVRAVVGHVTTEERLLVVSSANLKHIFDETDAWFIGQCAQTIDIVERERMAREALAARDQLLRAVTHELRTPIHGILSSVEMMEEEVNARAPASHEGQIVTLPWYQNSVLHPYLQMIRQSGTQLMTTVNNILRLNSSISYAVQPLASNYDLRRLEHDVLSEVLANYAEDQLHALSVQFSTEFSGGDPVVAVDADLLKELVKCLVFNAISATSAGTVQVTVTLSPEQKSLVIDVVDTGCGIGTSDHERIFLAFEKLDMNSRGVGVGLSLATKIATKMRGKVSLVSSQLGKGSHFRIELSQILTLPRSVSLPDDLPQRPFASLRGYYLVPGPVYDKQLISHIEQYLLQRGVERSQTAQGSMIIVSQSVPSARSICDQVGVLVGPHIVLYVTSARGFEEMGRRLVEEGQPHLNIHVTGPLYTSRLDDLLRDVGSAFEKFCAGLQTQLHGDEHHSWRNFTMCSQQVLAAATAHSVSGSRSGDLSARLDTPAPLKALLVDDNSVNLAVLKSFCRKRHILHTTADDGNKAVKAYLEAVADPGSNSAFMLVMMDLQMPECDGIEAVGQIRAIEEQRRLPRSIIFMITGQDSATDRTNSFDAGVDAFYVKPVSMKILDQAITEHFPRSGTEAKQRRA